ncbi:cobalamin-dependent protein [Paenibacillus sp. YSY-4.3]
MYYSIKQVSERLGIPPVTIRAWEKRYQIINPARSHGRHRLYSEEDIHTLLSLKRLMEEQNLKISEAVMLLRTKSAETYGLYGPYQGQPLNTTYAHIIARLYQDLIHFNAMQANETIDLAFSLYQYEDVFQRILVPTLYKIGDEWEQGEISVAQEHFASQLIMQRCVQFFRILPINEQLPRALAFCPPNEHHHMGLTLFSLFLRKKGLDVIYLGPDTPLHGLDDIIKLKKISIISISMTSGAQLEELEQWIELCRKSYPQLVFALGGTGFQNCSPKLTPYVVSADMDEWDSWYQAIQIRLP